LPLPAFYYNKKLGAVALTTDIDILSALFRGQKKTCNKQVSLYLALSSL